MVQIAAETEAETEVGVVANPEDAASADLAEVACRVASEVDLQVDSAVAHRGHLAVSEVGLPEDSEDLGVARQADSEASEGALQAVATATAAAGSPP